MHNKKHAHTRFWLAALGSTLNAIASASGQELASDAESLDAVTDSTLHNLTLSIYAELTILAIPSWLREKVRTVINCVAD